MKKLKPLFECQKSEISDHAQKCKAFLAGFQKGLKGFSYNMSIIVNTILLSIIYLVGVGFTAMIARISNKKFLDMNLSKKNNTYWSDLNLKKKPIEDVL